MNLWLSAFLNSFLFMVMGAIAVYVGLDMMFSKRHSASVFLVYMLVKGLLWSWYDASFVLGTLGKFEYAFQLLGTPLLGVVSYIVLYYTWKSDFYKIGGFLVDAIVSVVTTLVFLLADGPFPMVAPFDYRGYFGVGGLVRCAGMLALILVLLRFVRPLFKWFGSYEFVHKNIWQVVVIISIAAATLPRMTTTMQVARPVLIAIICGVLLLTPFVAYMASRMRVEQKRKALLEGEIALVEDYAHTIQGQLEYLEKSAVQIDEVAKEVARVQEGVESAYLNEQIDSLKNLCNHLKYGSYSDNPALDVVLTSYEEEFAKEDLQVDYRVQPLGDGAVRAALVSQGILAWALDSCKAAKGRGGTFKEPSPAAETPCEDGKGIKFRIIREGDQLVFVLTAPSNRRRRFSRSVLEERVPSFDGMFVETDDGVSKSVRALLLDT